ncbi:MAG: 50S ribosomal protein L18 [Candidatus Levybacteria bacterium]|nr:50S ribosomal protein L18 [Candidatus Levybacteria bacterium]
MDKNIQKLRRKERTRKKIKGTKDRPRLSVFKSNRFSYAQLINDETGETIVGVSEKHISQKVNLKKKELAKKVGILLAKKAQDMKIKKVVFDRGSYTYQGRVKEIAEGAREGGLKF